MITISLCMIVKNEEKVLARCLDSLAGLCDEIIIIDTGSSDSTRSIAERFTDKVYDFAWTGSFSDARNYSFSKASMEYIYCADADEVMDEKNRNAFLDLKSVLLPEVDIVQMYYRNQMSFNTVYNYDMEYRPKLFKRMRPFTWIDPVHESVRLEPVIFDSDIEIMHMPVSAHAPRDFSMLETILRSGGSLSKKLYGMYARELYIAGKDKDLLTALPFFESYFFSDVLLPEEIQTVTCVLARAYRIKTDTISFFKYALKNIASESCSEMCCELGDFYLEQKDYKEAAVWFYNAAYETESCLSAYYGRLYPLKQLVYCHEADGDNELAQLYRNKLTELM